LVAQGIFNDGVSTAKSIISGTDTVSFHSIIIKQ